MKEQPFGHAYAASVRRVLLYMAAVTYFCVPAVDAQGTGGAAQSEAVRAELTKRGLTEAEARAALAREGILLEQIPLVDLPQYRVRIEAVLDRLASEKAAAARSASESTVVPPIRAVSAAPTETPPRVVEAQADGEEIYGHAVFTNRSLELFRTTDGSHAPDSYVLGPGDVIRVSIFGASQADLSLEIASDGSVKPTGLPQIFLQGVRLADAKQLLRTRLAAYYTFNPDQLSLSVQTARTIAVSVFGEARSTGTYSVSALNSGFNLIAAAGGPTRIGSVRNIEIIRGAERRRMDVYALLSNPGGMVQYDLRQNDIIFIPIAAKIVRIDGAVRRPMRYELVDTEDLASLLTFAGGVNYNTSPDFVQVQSVMGDSVLLREWKLSDIIDGSQKVQLRDGDVVRVRSIGRPLDRFVEVAGAVFYEGSYDLDGASSLAQLMIKAQIKPQAKTDILFIERRELDGALRVVPVFWADSVRTGATVRLQARDRVIVLDKQVYANASQMTIEGSVKQAVTRSLAFGDSIRLADAITLAGGLLPTAAEFGYIFRRSLFNPERVNHIRFSTKRDTNQFVGPGDRVVIYDQRQYELVSELSISGAVGSPLRTTFDGNVHVSDLIAMAGGLTMAASKSRVDVFRLVIDTVKGASFSRIQLTLDSNNGVSLEGRPFSLQPFDQVVVREIPMFDTERNVELFGQVMYPGVYALKSSVVHLSDVIRQAGGVTELADFQFATMLRSAGGVGPVGIDLKSAMKSPGHPSFDPILLEGDVITIPRRTNTVTLRLRATRVGELAALGVVADGTAADGSATFSYQGPRSAKWYIREFAGGFAERAEKSSVTVTDPNGRVRGTARRLFFFRDYPTVLPGSTVSLRYEIEEPPQQEPSVNWDAVYTRSFQMLTTILSLIILSRQL